MKAKFLQPNYPLLKKVAQEIPEDQINSKNIRKIIETMLKVVQPFMVGLAAPQIGISKRIILVDVAADGKSLPTTPRKLGLRGGQGRVGDLRIYINPKIIWKSKREGEWYEGCYSTSRVCGIVSRPTSIKLQAFILTPQGWKFVEEKRSDYTARIFQHEIDHLDGKLFMDHIKNPDHLHWVEEKEFPLYRNKKAWRHWPKKHHLP